MKNTVTRRCSCQWQNICILWECDTHANIGKWYTIIYNLTVFHGEMAIGMPPLEKCIFGKCHSSVWPFDTKI